MRETRATMGLLKGLRGLRLGPWEIRAVHSGILAPSTGLRPPAYTALRPRWA